MTESKNNVRRDSSHHLTFPVLLICTGIVLLLNNSGVLPWEIWNVIFRFWPVILILAGIDFILYNIILGGLVSFLISVFVIVVIFSYSISLYNRSFDLYLTRHVPFWISIKGWLPEDNRNYQFFRNDPFNNGGKLFYRWN